MLVAGGACLIFQSEWKIPDLAAAINEMLLCQHHELNMIQ